MLAFEHGLAKSRLWYAREGAAVPVEMVVDWHSDQVKNLADLYFVRHLYSTPRRSVIPYCCCGLLAPIVASRLEFQQNANTMNDRPRSKHIRGDSLRRRRKFPALDGKPLFCFCFFVSRLFVRVRQLERAALSFTASSV